VYTCKTVLDFKKVKKAIVVTHGAQFKLLWVPRPIGLDIETYSMLYITYYTFSH
jgi:hypothetical protein